ncbi:hypothetical protein [Alistipes sp.]|uniref:hypothetical protein n=1 Tax=Alistipes sp. TaxID=1872444 RepID=UPI003AEFECDC
MESQDRKPRKRREREEIGGQVLADNLIGEIDRLEKVGEQAERTAAMYGRMFEDIKSTVLKVDTATLDAKTEEFADTLEQQAKRVRATVRTLKGIMWLLIVMLFLVFAVGYCYIEAHPWKEKYQQLEQQYIQLQTEMQALTAKNRKKANNQIL